PGETNKILGTEFKVGKTLAVVEQVPGTQDSFIALNIFEEGVDVNCGNLFQQEPRNMFHVTSRLELNKAVVISPEQSDNPTTPPGSPESPAPSADDDNDDNGREEGEGRREESSMKIPEGVEKAAGVAQATFLN